MTAVLEFDGLTFDEGYGAGLHLSGLVGWWDSPNPKSQQEDRPQGHGYFRKKKTYRDGRPVTVSGSYLGSSILDAQQMRLRLAAIQADGTPSPFKVSDESGSLMAIMELAGKVQLPDQLYSEYFEFSFQVSSADAFRYGESVPVSTGLASRGTGIVFPLAGWTGTPDASTSFESADGVVTRRNFATDPRATTSNIGTGARGFQARWFGGGNNAGTVAVRLGQTDGPTPYLTSYLEKTWTTVDNGGSTNLFDVAFSHMNNGSAGMPVTPGQVFTLSSYFWSSVAVNYGGDGGARRLTVGFYDQSGAEIYTVFGPNLPVFNANTWQRLSTTVTVPAGTAYMAAWQDMYMSGSAGTKIKATGLLIDDWATLRPYFDGGRPEGITFPITFGEPGSTGRATAVNTGTADTFSVFTVSGGRFEGGFSLVHVESGRQIRVDREIPMGSKVVIDSRKGTVLLDGISPIPGSLTRSEWWPVPRGGTATVQFLAIGATSGTPTLTVATAPASL